MADPSSKRSLAFALLLPLLALTAMIGRAEMTTRRGRPWLVNIKGYDPRDLVRGHYLRFQFDWRGGAPTEACADPTCCLCFQGEAGAAPPEPEVSRVSCDAVRACASWFHEDRLQSLHQFFIPEGRGNELEEALRSRKAQVVLRVSGGGDAVITDLLLDGVPWREVVKQGGGATGAPR